jgi:hypothetical protein
MVTILCVHSSEEEDFELQLDMPRIKMKIT